MPIRIDKIVTEVQVSTEDLPFSKKQVEQLTDIILARVQDQRTEGEALSRMMEIPDSARPKPQFRK